MVEPEAYVALGIAIAALGVALPSLLQLIGIRRDARAGQAQAAALDRTANANEIQGEQLKQLVEAAKKLLEDQRKLNAVLNKRVEALEKGSPENSSAAQQKIQLEERKIALKESEASWQAFDRITGLLM